jgi:hypothetical protein
MMSVLVVCAPLNKENHNMLTKPTSSAPKVAAALSVSDYIQQRVNNAVSNNFSSTKIWLKRHNLTEANGVLDAAGFQTRVVQEEPKSVQLEISW